MFLKDIMEMRVTSDNLNDSEEEPDHADFQAQRHTSRLLPLTPEPTPQDPAPLVSGPPEVPPDEIPLHRAPARRRRSQMASAGAQVDGRVLEYLRRAADEDAYDYFARSIVPLLRKVPDNRLPRFQSAIISFIDCATPPNNPRQCFSAIEHWRGLPEPSVGSNFPGPSQPATPAHANTSIGQCLPAFPLVLCLPVTVILHPTAEQQKRMHLLSQATATRPSISTTML
ncbi:uncharacterized protein LOC142741191 [Rhinoderma darwinii]|uniref:uncharacterized protein LOC142741191 n=1 Tax=Rhinoderma darwinii TaxID=43563 RepID=UPI003F66F341